MVMQHSPPPKPIVSSLSSTTNNILAWGDLRRLNIIYFIFEFLHEFLFIWEAISKTPLSVSSDVQTTRGRSQKTRLCLIFQPTSRCLDIGWSIACRVWYITWNCWHKHFVALVTDYRFCRLSVRTMQYNDKCHTDLYSDLACISHILQYCFNIDSQCQASREA